MGEKLECSREPNELGQFLVPAFPRHALHCLGKQAVDRDFIAISDIHLAVRNRRDSEFHRATCRISRALCLRTVIQFDGEIRRVVRSQNSSRAGW